MRKCQDLPALEQEGGDDEDRSLSLWSLSSVEGGAAGLLQNIVHTPLHTICGGLFIKCYRGTKSK